MNPIAYNLIDPNEAIIGGLKLGTGIQAIEQERLKAEQARAAAAEQQRALNSLAMNPNAGHADYSAVMTAYPALAENLGKALKVRDEGQKQNWVNFGSRVYSAALSGNNAMASELLRERAKGDTGNAQHWNVMADLFEKSPGAAKTIAAMNMAALMGPDKFATTFQTLGQEQRAADKAPAELAKAQEDARGAVGTADKAIADAVIAGEKAKVAQQTVLLDLEKQGWDIKKVQEDIKIARENARISAMNAAIAREGNDLKRQELRLKIDDAVKARDEKIREKVATAEAGATNIDNMLNTVQRILKNPSLDSVLGSLEGKAYYPNATLGMLNPGGDGDERADAIALIDTLGSQAFLAQIPNIKGMGALSNAEGEKLQSALQNLNRAQSEKQFRANLNEASRLLLKGRENISRASGVPLPKPDTPAAPGARPPLSAFEVK